MIRPTLNTDGQLRNAHLAQLGDPVVQGRVRLRRASPCRPAPVHDATRNSADRSAAAVRRGARSAPTDAQRHAPRPPAPGSTSPPRRSRPREHRPLAADPLRHPVRRPSSRSPGTPRRRNPCSAPSTPGATPSGAPRRAERRRPASRAALAARASQRPSRRAGPPASRESAASIGCGPQAKPGRPRPRTRGTSSVT